MNKNELRKKFIYSRIIILSIFIFVGSINYSFCDLFQLFDVEHYFNIALNGYVSDYLYAFFPFFPLIIRVFSVISTNTLFLIISICLLNNIATYITSIYLYKLIEIYCPNNKNLIYSIWLYSPVAFFTVIPYTEALFLLFTVISFYLYKEKKNYFVMGILIGLSVATRNVGSILFFTIFIGMVIKREKFINIIKTYIPATIISCLYPAYLYIHTGQWNRFMTIQSEQWGRVNSNFFTLIATDLNKLIHSDFIIIKLVIVIILTMLIFMFVLVITNIIKLIKKDCNSDFELILYLLLSFIAICSSMRSKNVPTPSSVSMHRYVAGAFSIYLLLPKNQKILRYIYKFSLFVTIIISIFMGFELFFG